MGDVENEVGRIQAVLQVGHENLSRLIAQLDPILSQPLPADNEKSVPAQTTCPLGEALRQMGNLAQELARRITEVSERVCL